MTDMTLHINGSERKVNVAPETPVLWVVRDTLGIDRNEIWLWRRSVRRLHGPCGWRAGAFLFNSGVASRGEEHHNHRGLDGERAASSAAGMDRGAGTAVRLLSDRPNHGCRGPAGKDSPAL